jgi:hypothetical protein
LVFLYKLLCAIDLIPVEPATILKPDGIEPELGFVVVTLDVNVGRLITILQRKRRICRDRLVVQLASLHAAFSSID